MARINSYTKITGAPADSDCFIIDSTQGTAGTRIVLWSVLKSVLTGIFAPKAHKHPGSDITSAVANANAATNDSVGQNIASTYVKELTVDGRTITVKRGNNTTYTFQTQDTTYPIADSQHDGLLSKSKYADLNWVREHYFEHVGVVDHNGTPALHFTNNAAGSVANDYVDAANATHSGIMATGDWQKLHAMKTIDSAVEIQPGTDLNNVRNPGYYSILYRNDTQVSNMPVTGYTTAMLIVFQHTPGTMISQIYIRPTDVQQRNGRDTMFVRYRNSKNEWQPWQDITAYPSVTQSANGLMSSADKRKLDGLSNDYSGAIGLATSSKDGLMSKGDKAKLDAIGSISDGTIDGFFKI